MPNPKTNYMDELRTDVKKNGKNKVLEKYDEYRKKYPKIKKITFQRRIREIAQIEDGVPEETSNSVIQKRYSGLCRKEKRIISKTEFREREPKFAKEVSDRFDTFDDFIDECRVSCSASFSRVMDHRVWNNTRHKTLQGELKNYKRFIITTLVTGSGIHKDFHSSLKSYAKRNKAKILYLVADNNISALPTEWEGLDIVFDDLKLNSNCYLSTIKILPKMINPFTGLKRLGKGLGAFILGSPKQDFEVIAASSKSDIPYCLFTPGAVTMPRYMGAKYYQKRTDYLAEKDHVMGALLVEIENSKIFHTRQFEMMKGGSFNDLGTLYNPDGSTEEQPASALVMGDWHSGDTDPVAAKCWEEVAEFTGAKIGVVHDGFNGCSVNHHEFNKHLNKAKLQEEGKMNLQDELDKYAYDLNRLTEVFDKLYVVKSNHDDFLNTYLQEARYVQDPQNHLISLDLAKQVIEGKNPIEWYVAQQLKNPERVKWLKRDEHTYIEGFLISDHGDKGPNGSRGSLVSLESTTEKGVYAHGHSPKLKRNSCQVGTSTYLRLPYNDGASSWLQSSIEILPGGARQLLTCIRGKWKL